MTVDGSRVLREQEASPFTLRGSGVKKTRQGHSFECPFSPPSPSWVVRSRGQSLPSLASQDSRKGFR